MTTTTTLRPAVAGDVGDTRTVRLDGVENLSGASAVAAHVWRNNDDDQATLTATVLDDEDRTVTIELGGAEGWLAADAVGGYTYNVEVQVTFLDGDVLTWPGDRPLRLAVRRQGEA